MAEITLILNAEEKELLANLLEREISQRLVEEHRTRTPSYRHYIEQDEAILQNVLAKLNGAAATVGEACSIPAR